MCERGVGGVPVGFGEWVRVIGSCNVCGSGVQDRECVDTGEISIRSRSLFG